MRVGISSKFVIDDDAPAAGFASLARAGFDAVDFGVHMKLDYKAVCGGATQTFFSQSDDALKAYYAPHKAAAAEYGIFFSQLHAPFPVYALPEETEFQEQANELLFEATVKSLMICQFLESPYLVVHPVRVWGDPDGRRTWDVNMAMYRRLIPEAKKYGVKVCTENLFHGKGGIITTGAGSDIDTAIRMLDRLNEEAGEELFVYCFDLGHATLLGKNIPRTIHRLGHRLQVLHLHDNDGRTDLHMQPYAYKRGDYVTDWDGLCRGLRDIGYKGAISFESAASLWTLPKELYDPMLEYTAAVGHYFKSKIEK